MSETAEGLVGRTVRHYKGGEYLVLGVARHSETLAPLVVYLSPVDGAMWARPEPDFLAEVTDPATGSPVRRFTEVGRPVSFPFPTPYRAGKEKETQQGGASVRKNTDYQEHMRQLRDLVENGPPQLRPVYARWLANLENLEAADRASTRYMIAAGVLLLLIGLVGLASCWLWR